MRAQARERRTRRAVARGALAAAAALGLALPALAEAGWVRGAPLNLRTGQGSQYRILGTVETGDRVEILQRGEDWTRVRTQDGQTGWIRDGYLDAEAPPSERLESLQGETQSLRSRLEEIRREAEALREENRTLSRDDEAQASQLAELKEENYRLRAGERWAEWLTGALLLGTGMALGALLARLSRGRRQRLRL